MLEVSRTYTESSCSLTTSWQKHLMHLKVIQEMAKVPRGPGIPPLNDASFNEALIIGSNNNMSGGNGSTQSPLPLLPMSDNDPRINPLAGLGLSDEQYAQILHTMVQGDSMSGYNNGNDDGSGAGSSSGSAVGNGTDGGSGAGPLVKRVLEDPERNPREDKRSRFQVVE